MSISTTSTKDSYAGNNTTDTPYPITFKYLERSHLTVYVDNVEISDSYYTLTGDGTTGTGRFTTALAYPSTKSVTVVLDVPFDQPTSLQETGALPAKTLEESYDRLNMQIRRVWRKVQNTLTFATDEGGTGSQGTADNLLGFDGTGDLTEIPNSKFCETANNLSDVDAATARTNLGVDVAGTDNSTDVTLAGTGTQASLAGQALTINKITAGNINSESATVGQVLQADGDTTCSFVDLVGGGNAQTANPLSQFASTTSAEFAGVISDETGTGALVFADAPTIDLTNATNTPLPASGAVTEAMLNASTNASLDKADGSVQVANNLSDVTASTARTNLGLAIGSDVQAYSSVLDDIVTLPSVTGTATFTNSTNNIALIGVGSITGLAVGDVIEVTGSTSNNDVFTVEAISDSDNIKVNEEHAGDTTSKSLTGETNTASVTVTLVCKANNAPLGYGQGWVEVTRSVNSNITNSTGRMISVGASAVSNTASNATCNGLVDGLDVTLNRNDDLNNYVRTLSAYFNVPDGRTYRVNTSGVNAPTWLELR